MSQVESVEVTDTLVAALVEFDESELQPTINSGLVTATATKASLRADIGFLSVGERWDESRPEMWIGAGIDCCGYLLARTESGVAATAAVGFGAGAAVAFFGLRKNRNITGIR